MSELDDLPYITKEWYDEKKAALEAAGYIVKTKWRKNLKVISIGEIVLSEDKS